MVTARPKSNGTWIVLALIAGMALGVVIAASGATALASLVEKLASIGTLWLNALRMTVIPRVGITEIAHSNEFYDR